jgi:hypothetical protein
MKRTRTRKCLCCGELFEPDRRNAKRQMCCPKKACRAALKAARQRRWLEQPRNRDYFRGAEHLERVRAWRAAHPGYWRRGKGLAADALQDAHGGQAVDAAQDSGTPAARALQDALRLQGPVLIGLIAHLSDSTLQEDIAQTSRRLLQLGQDILSGRAPDAPQATPVP